MKILKLSLIVLFVLLFSPSFSQKTTKKVTKEICNCFDKIDLKQSAAQVKKESEACLTQSMIENIEGLMKEYKIKEGDTEASRKMGESIAKKLLKECPSAMPVFMILGSSEEEEKGEE